MREALAAYVAALRDEFNAARQKYAEAEGIIKRVKPELERMQEALNETERAEELDFVDLDHFALLGRISIVAAIDEILGNANAPINRPAILSRLEEYAKQGRILRVPNPDSLRATLSAGVQSKRWERSGDGAIETTFYALPGGSDVPF